MLSSSDLNALGQVIDTTWGRSSTSKSSNMSIKAHVKGDKLVITYSSYGTFASSVAMNRQVPAFANEGEQATDSYLKTVKEGFKDSVGRELKTKWIDSKSNVEIVDLQPHISQKRTVLFRYVTVLSVE